MATIVYNCEQMREEWMTVNKGGRSFKGDRMVWKQQMKEKAKLVWYADLWVLLSAVSVSRHFVGKFLPPLWVYAFLSHFDKQRVNFVHSPAFSVQSEWRRRRKKGERKGRRKRGWVGWGLRERDKRKKDVEEDRKYTRMYTKQQHVYNYASGRIPQYITTEISQPTYFK